jgi:hypothetical protein
MTTGMTTTENEMENLSLPEFEKKREYSILEIKQ